MSYEHRTDGFIKIRITEFGLIAIAAFISTLLFAQQSSANINSPQGALDIASILPGKYAFADKTKTQPQPQAEKQIGEERNAPDVSSVGELLELMKQATEVVAMLPEKAPASAAKSDARQHDNVPGLGETLRIASMVPKYKMSNPLQMIKARQFEWPVDGSIYSAFKATRGRRQHGAIDIVADKGTPVVAAADGVVSVVANGGKNFSGYGRIVILDHGHGVHTVYAHCDTTPVKMGQRVKKGQVVATVGRTGRVTTNLLHFEVRVAGKKIDPLTCMAERPGVVKMVNYKSGK